MTLSPTRRSVLAGAALSALSGSIARAESAGGSLENSPSLKAARAGQPLFGLVAPVARLAENGPAFSRMAGEMGLFTLESDFQWSAMETSPGVWDFHRTDAGVYFATSHGVAVAGHAIYYHYFIPEWLRSSEDSDALTAALNERIAKTVARYAGKVQRWDVVNEPLNSRDGLPEGMRATAYSRVFGDRFIDIAFKLARAADPGALLCLNEAEFEYADQQEKRDNLLALLRRLKQRGVPVDVLGIQSHLVAEKAIDDQALQRFLKAVHKLGIKVAVTELDVLDDKLPADPGVRDKLVAQHAQRYLRIVRDNSDVVSVTCWGYSDRFTWLDMWHKRSDGRPLRPLPFDFDLMRKPLWAVIRDIIRT